MSDQVTAGPAAAATPAADAVDRAGDTVAMSIDAVGMPAPEATLMARASDGRPVLDPTPDDVKEAMAVVETTLDARRTKANRATRGVLAALLCLEALVVLLVPRAIARTSTGLDSGKTIALVVLAVALVATGFMLKRAWGIGLGSALQVVLVLTGIWTIAMLVVGLVFAALWMWVLTMRRDLVGTSGGVRMLVS